jgi:signal peptidase II
MDYTDLYNSGRWYRDWAFLPIAVVIFGIDQLSKYIVVTNMFLGQSIPEHGIFRFTYIYNTGALFGLFPNQTFLLIIASFLGIGFLLIFYHLYRFPGIFLRISLGLQLGGAFGNLVDRVRLGYVTDFIDVGPWPVFNLADSSIVIGLAVIAYVILFKSEYAEESKITKIDSESTKSK